MKPQVQESDCVCAEINARNCPVHQNQSDASPRSNRGLACYSETPVPRNDDNIGDGPGEEND